MVCIRVDPKTAEELAIVGGEPVERMHVTLAYLGHAIELPPEADETITSVMTSVAERHPKHKAELSGIARFENADVGEDAVVALLDSPELEKLRSDLVHELKEAGIPVSDKHGFTPHITIAYVSYHEQLPVSRIGGLDLKVGAMEYVQGDMRVARTPLRGKVEKSITSAALDDAGALNADVEKTVVREGGEYCVVDDSGREYGCYATEREAEERLGQLQFNDLESRVTKFFPISKSDVEQRLVYGIVLEPDEVDAQNDTINVEGIQKTAHNFLAKYNRESEMGHMHQRLGDIGVDLVESYIAPVDFTIGEEPVKKGSWLMTARVNDDKLWADVKSGKLTGFSVAGIATIQDS